MKEGIERCRDGEMCGGQYRDSKIYSQFFVWVGPLYLCMHRKGKCIVHYIISWINKCVQV